VCKVRQAAQHRGRALTRKYPSGRPAKRQICARVEMWRCGKRWMRAGCFKPRTLYNPSPRTPEKGPLVAIEWEVGCAPAADWTVGLSRKTLWMQIRTVD